MPNIINNGPMIKDLNIGSCSDSIRQINDTMQDVNTKLSKRSKYSSLGDLQANGIFTKVCTARDKLQQQESLVSELNDTKNIMKKTDNYLSNIRQRSESVLPSLQSVISHPEDVDAKNILKSLTDGVLKIVYKDINSINDFFGSDRIDDITSKSNIENTEPTANYMKTSYNLQTVTTGPAFARDIGIDFSDLTFQKIIASLHKIKEAKDKDAYEAARELLTEGIAEFDSKIKSSYILSYQSIEEEIKNLEKQNLDLKMKITEDIAITEIKDYAPLIQEVFQLHQIHSVVTSLFANTQRYNMQAIMALMGK